MPDPWRAGLTASGEPARSPDDILHIKHKQIEEVMQISNGTWKAPELLAELPELFSVLGTVRVPYRDTFSPLLKVDLANPMKVASEPNNRGVGMNSYTKHIGRGYVNGRSVLIPHEGDTALWLHIDLWGYVSAARAVTINHIRDSMRTFAHKLATEGVIYSIGMARECHPGEMTWGQGKDFLRHWFGPNRRPITADIPYRLLRACNVSLPDSIFEIEDLVSRLANEPWILRQRTGLPLSSDEEQALLSIIHREIAIIRFRM